MTARHVLFAIAWLAFGALAFIGVARNADRKRPTIQVVKTIVIPHKQFVHAGVMR